MLLVSGSALMLTAGVLVADSTECPDGTRYEALNASYVSTCPVEMALPSGRVDWNGPSGSDANVGLANALRAGGIHASGVEFGETAYIAKNVCVVNSFSVRFDNGRTCDMLKQDGASHLIACDMFGAVDASVSDAHLGDAYAVDSDADAAPGGDAALPTRPRCTITFTPDKAGS